MATPTTALLRFDISLSLSQMFALPVCSHYCGMAERGARVEGRGGQGGVVEWMKNDDNDDDDGGGVVVVVGGDDDGCRVVVVVLVYMV